MLLAAGVPAAPSLIGETGQAVPAVASRLPPRLSSLRGCSSTRGEAIASGAACGTFCDTASGACSGTAGLLTFAAAGGSRRLSLALCMRLGACRLLGFLLRLSRLFLRLISGQLIWSFNSFLYQRLRSDGARVAIVIAGPRVGERHAREYPGPSYHDCESTQHTNPRSPYGSLGIHIAGCNGVTLTQKRHCSRNPRAERRRFFE